MKSIFLSFCFLFSLTFSFSQDYLVKINGDSIRVKITEIGLTEVKYKYYNDLSGLTYGIYKSEVKWIRYENGRVERFDGVEENADKNLSPEEKCSCGRSDAEMYHGMKGAAFASGYFCGPFALLGTAIFRQTPRSGARTVKLSKHKALFHDPYYLKCYNKRAKSDLLKAEGSFFLAEIAVIIVVLYGF